MRLIRAALFAAVTMTLTTFWATTGAIAGYRSDLEIRLDAEFVNHFTQANGLDRVVSDPRFANPVAGSPQAGVTRMAQADAAREIITLPNKTPQRADNRNPSAQALIETWLSGYGWGKDKHFDLERMR